MHGIKHTLLVQSQCMYNLPQVHLCRQARPVSEDKASAYEYDSDMCFASFVQGMHDTRKTCKWQVESGHACVNTSKVTERSPPIISSIAIGPEKRITPVRHSCRTSSYGGHIWITGGLSRYGLVYSLYMNDGPLSRGHLLIDSLSLYRPCASESSQLCSLNPGCSVGL